MKKLLLLSLLLTSNSFFGQATLPAYEGFDYSVGSLLIDDNSNTGTLSANWYDTTPRNPSDAFVVASPTWTATGLPTPTGNAFSIKGSGNKPEFQFIPQATGYGEIYMSCLIKVTDVSALSGTGGDDFIGFGAYSGSTGNPYGIARVYIRLDAGGTGYNLGININTNDSDTVWDSGVFNVDQEVFLVVKKKEDTSSNDDCQLFINPTVGGTEPTPDVTAGPRASFPSIVRIYQTSGALTPEVYIDEMRVANTWIEVTGGVLGLKDNSISNLKVYPNPVANGKLVIESKNNTSMNLKVFNLLGQKVLETETRNQPVDVSSLAKGAYVLKITEGNSSGFKKIIVK